MSGILNWSGVDEPIYRTNQPHLYFYLLAIWGSVFGFSEPAMHAVQSLAALACVLLFYRLARFFTGNAALWTTALVILGPAFIVEQNLMVDVPLLATWLAFFNVLICDVRSERQTRRYVVAALACSAALLIKYSSLTLLPILGASILLERRRAQAWTLLIPIAALAAWSMFNVMDYGGVHIATRPGDARHTPLRPLVFAAAWIVTLGGLTPLGLVALVQGRPATVKAQIPIYLAVSGAFAVLAALVALGWLDDDTADKFLWAAFMANGALMCLALAPAIADLPFDLRDPEAARQAAPVLYLLLWIAGGSAFYVLFAPFIASRHVLLIIPAITLLLVGGWGPELTRASKVFALGAMVVVSAGLALSDWRFAAFYRTEAATLARNLPQAGAKWASGHWGWQWYAARNGFRQVDIKSSVLRPGDDYLVATDADHQPLRRPPLMVHLRTDVQAAPLLSLLCTARTMRFYLSSATTAPWSLSRECFARVDIFRVVGGAPRPFPTPK